MGAPHWSSLLFYYECVAHQPLFPLSPFSCSLSFFLSLPHHSLSLSLIDSCHKMSTRLDHSWLQGSVVAVSTHAIVSAVVRLTTGCSDQRAPMDLSQELWKIHSQLNLLSLQSFFNESGHQVTVLAVQLLILLFNVLFCAHLMGSTPKSFASGWWSVGVW